MRPLSVLVAVALLSGCGSSADSPENTRPAASVPSGTATPAEPADAAGVCNLTADQVSGLVGREMVALSSDGEEVTGTSCLFYGVDWKATDPDPIARVQRAAFPPAEIRQKFITSADQPCTFTERDAASGSIWCPGNTSEYVVYGDAGDGQSTFFASVTLPPVLEANSTKTYPKRELMASAAQALYDAAKP